MESSFKEFNDLPISTLTCVLYTNFHMDYRKIFQHLEVNQVPYRQSVVAKKRKGVSKKDVLAPYGTIASAILENKIRGLDMRKTVKKHWCSFTCRATEIDENGDERKVYTVIEEVVASPDSDVREIKYFCTMCQRYYNLHELKKICNFLNQLTIVLSLGDEVYLNIMIFSNKIKIVGCKKKKHAYEAMMILWDEYFSKYDSCIMPLEAFEEMKKINNLPKKAIDIPPNTPIPEDFVPRIVFRTVMRNVDFRMGFTIDKFRFNQFMTSLGRDIVKSTFCDTSSQTNIRTKFHTHRPDDHLYRVLYIPRDKEPYFEQVRDLPARINKKKVEVITFIVFNSKVILTGRYKKDTKRTYDMFVQNMLENRQKIEEDRSIVYNNNIDLSQFIFT